MLPILNRREFDLVRVSILLTSSIQFSVLQLLSEAILACKGIGNFGLLFSKNQGTEMRERKMILPIKVQLCTYKSNTTPAAAAAAAA